MKLILESTEQVLDMTPREPGEAIQGRVWVGKTESGIPVQALIVRVAVESTADQTQFQFELTEQHAPPPASQAFPLRMVL